MSSSKRCGAIGMWPGSDKAKNDHRPETLGLLGQGRISNAESGDRNRGTQYSFPLLLLFRGYEIRAIPGDPPRHQKPRDGQPVQRNRVTHRNRTKSKKSVTHNLYLGARAHPEYAYGHSPHLPLVLDGTSFGFGVSCGEDITGSGARVAETKTRSKTQESAI